MARSRKGELKHTNKYNCIADNHLDYRPEYKIWGAMIHRCTNPKNDMYYCYGGRGIEVCDRWLNKKNGFINFYNDMGKRPLDNDGRPYQIDRIDNSKGYCPDNCRWVPRIKNARNKSSNNTFIVYGELMCLKQLCEIFKINRNSVNNRMKRTGEDKYTALFHILSYSGFELSPLTTERNML